MFPCFLLQEIIYSNQRYIQIYTQLRAKLADKKFEDPTLNILKKELLFHMKKFAGVVLNKQNTQPKKQSDNELRQGVGLRRK